MPLGTNPTLLQIQAFFGGPGNLRAYYRGGPYVPDIPANAAISTDPNSLRQTQFSGADKAVDWTVDVSPGFVQIGNTTAWTYVNLTISVANAPGAATYLTTASPPDGMLGQVNNPTSATPQVQARRQASQPSGDIGVVQCQVTINGVSKSKFLQLFMQ